MAPVSVTTFAPKSPAALPAYPFANDAAPLGLREGSLEFVQNAAREEKAWSDLDAEKQAVEDSFSAGDAVPLARVVRSVVAEAGLSRFVYLNGASGRRYVFSSIQPNQVALYDKALFAATAIGGNVLRVSDKADDVIVPGTLLHVHLLDEDAQDGKTVLADLNLTLAS